MTTNAIDTKRRLIASDSRWSYGEGDDVFYVDDTGFEKIVSRAFGSIICAGDARLIEAWRNWFMTRIINLSAPPQTERIDNHGELQSITISLVARPEGKVVFSNGWYRDFEDYAKFSGSGAEFAVECFAVNRCGKTCIQTAAQRDPMTGGEIKFHDFHSDETNAGYRPVTLEDVEKQFLTRGMVMNTKTKKVSPIQEHAKFASGANNRKDFSLSAPTGQPQRAWEASEKRRLLDAVKELAGDEARED